MKFAMLKITGKPVSNRHYSYTATIMEKGGSPKWPRTFDSECEMIDTVNDIFAKQKRPLDVAKMLKRIRGGELYFFDLELTRQDAEASSITPRK